MNDAPAVRLQDVAVGYGSELVLHGIELDVRRSEILGLVGGSGSGKTTLLRTMLGLQQPRHGHLEVLGQHVNSGNGLERVRNRIGVLFQHGALFSALSVFDNVALPLREEGFVESALVRELVALKLSMVGLQPRDAARMPSELSGGMIKRVALARALALDPALLFLDEPTSGLDPVAGERFVSLLGALRGELGLTVVMVTHDLDTLVDLCDRVAVLADGRIIAAGTLQEVATVSHPFCKGFFHGVRARRVLGLTET